MIKNFLKKITLVGENLPYSKKYIYLKIKMVNLDPMAQR